RYRDVNLLISGLIDSNSKILINRDIGTRVMKAAPFLKYDKDPYAAIVDGRLVYIWDAYTTTDLYPYSERVNLSTITNADLSGRSTAATACGRSPVPCRSSRRRPHRRGRSARTTCCSSSRDRTPSISCCSSRSRRRVARTWSRTWPEARTSRRRGSRRLTPVS